MSTEQDKSSEMIGHGTDCVKVPEAATLPLIRGTTTLQDALEQEEDMLLDLDYPQQRIDFFVSLYGNREKIVDIVSYHLGLNPSDTCWLGEVKEWIHGSFNVCIPVYIRRLNQSPGKSALIRFPLPYKIGELENPGNLDEKIRCEAATFIWMQEHCPEVPIPQLHGFGLADGHIFTIPEHVPLNTRVIWYLKRCISWLMGSSLPCRYVRHHRPAAMLDFGYLVMEYVGNPGVQMLSETWDEDRHQQHKRTNLFRGLSHIMLSLSQIPLPCIGSWTLDSNGFLKFSNRPLNLRIHQLENGRIPTGIPRSLTYSSTDAYYLDLLSCHDKRIRYQPNSIIDEDDGRDQMARLTIMRALLPHFADRELRQGPFFYRLTDLHPSNIFVDSDWNIKWVIDLEWACSLPAETLRAPYWLTGRSVDRLTDKHLDTFDHGYREFVDIFEKEEESFPPINDIYSYRTKLLRRSWETGSFWYFQALDSPKGLFNLFHQHIHPIFAPSHDVDSKLSRGLSEYWASDTDKVIAAKLKDKEEYEKTICRRFDEAADQT
ncbi:hypothetical protein N7456_011843 [Penicillium angulare]|uniref:Aminoglycoside phosphotransferase domain-containing protein n=1 Tax=Penicillium angulare TaxID=116970 RepID=A0A9W9EUE8_9EURO|nr:hypothetical protein N7456_011843 [Penicillium angulare]